jgi:hypothetical protein
MLLVLKRAAVFTLVCWTTQFAISQKTPVLSAETQQHIKAVESGLVQGSC